MIFACSTYINDKSSKIKNKDMSSENSIESIKGQKNANKPFKRYKDLLKNLVT